MLGTLRFVTGFSGSGDGPTVEQLHGKDVFPFTWTTKNDNNRLFSHGSTVRVSERHVSPLAITVGDVWESLLETNVVGRGPFSIVIPRRLPYTSDLSVKPPNDNVSLLSGSVSRFRETSLRSSLCTKVNSIR